MLCNVVVLEPCEVRLSTSELEDLSQSELWKHNSEWSNEVQEIRSELVHGKWLSHSEICLRLKTLKLVDKKVCVCVCVCVRVHACVCVYQYPCIRFVCMYCM